MEIVVLAFNDCIMPGPWHLDLNSQEGQRAFVTPTPSHT